VVSTPVARREQGNHQRGPGTVIAIALLGSALAATSCRAASHTTQERGGHPALGSAPTGVVEGKISSGGRIRYYRLFVPSHAFYTLADGGHSWPGGEPVPKVFGPTSTSLNATNKIWKFFISHERA
jgi:poly(3-hydroxybutyrate) depolymerase